MNSTSILSNTTHGENDFIHSDGAWAIAAICTIVASAVSIYNVYLHLKNYTEPRFQLWIVRILLIVPLYGLVSWLSMKLHDEALYFETIRDIYEAFVIYCFLALILEYVGGEDKCMNSFNEKPTMAHPFPLCWLPRLRLNVLFLRFCKQGTLQFVIIKPVMAIISLIMVSRNLYDDDAYQGFLLTIYNISYSVALYALLLFYLAIKDDVKEYNCVWKFFSVKTIVFATYWQNLMILWMNVDHETGMQWNDFVLCCEMLFFALLHYRYFQWQEFEFRAEMPDKTALTNMKGVLSIKDVVKDIKHSFKPTYKEYILTGAKSHEGDVLYKTKTWEVINAESEDRGREVGDVEIEVAEFGYDMRNVKQPKVVTNQGHFGVENRRLSDSDGSDSSEYRNLPTASGTTYGVHSDPELGDDIREGRRFIN